jgi:uncharacterized protein YegJ (DUF2314 family)
MRLLIAIAFALAFAQPALAQEGQDQPERQGDPIVQFTDDDVVMNAAIADARRSYPQFLAHFDAAPERDRAATFMIKVGLPSSDGGHEHIWVYNLRREAGRLIGDLANEPNLLPGMNLGSRVEIIEDQVSDWAIITREGMYGSYTTRVMLPHLPPAEAEETRRFLTPSPIPADWSS